jgi:hypothetical protein
MKAKEINGQIKTYNRLPKSYGNIMAGFDLLPDNELQSFGFYNVVYPDFDNDVQELGDLVFDQNINAYTYQVNDLTWSETLAELKENKLKSLKDITTTKLGSTDWYVIRQIERNIDIPSSIQQERSIILQNHEEQIVEINNLSTKANVVKYEFR